MAVAHTVQELIQEENDVSSTFAIDPSRLADRTGKVQT
jgi:hypothetical protein